MSLGVAPETARIDAEGIEHHVSEETLGGLPPRDGREQEPVIRRPAPGASLASQVSIAETSADRRRGVVNRGLQDIDILNTIVFANVEPRGTLWLPAVSRASCMNDSLTIH